MFSAFYFYTIQNIINILYYIVYKYCILYIVQIQHVVHCTNTAYNSPRMGNVVVELVAQHSAFILCVRLSLDNSYGTIIS
jgi:hypothetical protein